MKISFFSTQPYDKIFFDRFNKRHEIQYFESHLDEQTAKLANGSQAVCVFVNDKISASIIKKLVKNDIKLIVLRSAGFNNVDLLAAKEHNVTVLRVPAYSPFAVAEHAIALILTLNRKTHKAYNRVREGNFSLEHLIGFDLHKKTVGVVGTGKIGEVFCNIIKGFGCKIVAFDLIENSNLQKEGVTYLTLADVLAQSDIVSLHCPLNDETRHLINDNTLAKMKSGAMLINTGRGALIDSSAVINALKSGHLGYLGIDVYEQEENLFFRDFSNTIIHDDVILRLLSFPNVLVTAHQAFLTEEALSQIATITLQNISDFEDEKVLVNIV
jgi:D-lactate dehydrogenase